VEDRRAGRAHGPDRAHSASLDEIGLLSAQRSEGGHRVYDEASVLRLYRIVSLRSLGFPLDAIAEALDSEHFDPRAAV
jgi:DNA-binding transcriptional MerR regulator